MEYSERTASSWSTPVSLIHTASPNWPDGMERSRVFLISVMVVLSISRPRNSSGAGIRKLAEELLNNSRSIFGSDFSLSENNDGRKVCSAGSASCRDGAGNLQTDVMKALNDVQQPRSFDASYRALVLQRTWLSKARTQARNKAASQNTLETS